MHQKDSESKPPTFLKWYPISSIPDRRLFRIICVFLHDCYREEWKRGLGFSNKKGYKLWLWTLENDGSRFS